MFVALYRTTSFLQHSASAVQMNIVSLDHLL